MNEEKKKVLNLMRFWLFGTFAIVFAAITIYIGMFTNQDWMMALRAGFPIWGIVAALCIVTYYGYKFWISRGSAEGSSQPPASSV